MHTPLSEEGNQGILKTMLYATCSESERLSVCVSVCVSLWFFI